MSGCNALTACWTWDCPAKLRAPKSARLLARVFYLVLIAAAGTLASPPYAAADTGQISASLPIAGSGPDPATQARRSAAISRLFTAAPSVANSGANLTRLSRLNRPVGKRWRPGFSGQRVVSTGATGSQALSKPLISLRAKHSSPLRTQHYKSRSVRGLASINADPDRFTALFDGDSVRVLKGKFPLQPSRGYQALATDFPARARSFLMRNSEELRLGSANFELEVKRNWSDELGKNHVVFHKTFKGTPILHEEISVHGDHSHTYFVNARYRNLEVNPTSQAGINSQQAFEIIQGKLNWPISGLHDGGMPKLALWEHEGQYRYVYAGEVLTTDLINWRYLVDAASGEILELRDNRKSQLVSARGVDGNGQPREFTAWKNGGAYYLFDPSVPRAESSYARIQLDGSYTLNGDQLVGDMANQDSLDDPRYWSTSTSANSGWDPIAVSAFTNTRRVYDYYRVTHNRDSMDNRGMNLYSIIHYSSGEEADNAYWNGALMIFGDGHRLFDPLANCLDIAAHEMTHGVIEHSTNLLYKNQSGALNESFADIMAAMVDADDWTIGEDCTIVAPGYLRSLANPESGLPPQPGKMSNYVHLPNTERGDSGGVHINSGIPNRAAWLVAVGLSQEGLGVSIGRAKTGKIFYRALTSGYLNPLSEFIDARFATEQAAEDLYGANTTEYRAVSKAWDVVEVGTGVTGTPPATVPLETLPGQDSLVFLHPIDGVYDDPFAEYLDIYRQNLEQPFTGYDPGQLSGPINKRAYAAPTRPAPATFEGEYFLLYVGIDSNIYLILPNGEDELFLEQESISSIATSPDTRYLAVTSTEEDLSKSILVWDSDIERWLAFPLRTPNYTQGAEILSTALYADSLAFDYTGKKIIYDYFSCIPLPNRPCDADDPFGYWSIAELHLEENRTSFPFPSHPPEFDLGYPRYADNSDRYFVFDIIDAREEADDPQEDLSGIWIFDIHDQDFRWGGYPGKTADGARVWGVPSFSGGDDYVVYRAGDANFVGVFAFRSPLANYRLSGGDTVNLNPLQLETPVAHRNASRTVRADLMSTTSSISFGEVAASSSTVKNFRIRNQGNRSIEITDVSTTGKYFSTDLTNTTLNVNEELEVAVTLNAGRIGGSVAEVLSIDHNGDNPELIINMRANVVGSQYTVEIVDSNRNGAIDWNEGIRVGELNVNGSDMQLLRLYSGALGRVPDLGGFDFWRSRIAAGTEFGRMGDEFFWSREMQIQMDVNGDGRVVDSELVNHLYVNVLGRSPDQGGFDYWISRLASGDSEGVVIASFLNGQEYIESTVGLFADFALDNSQLFSQ